MIVITIVCNDCNVFGAKDHRMTATSMRYYLREKGWNTLNSAIDLCPRCNRERKKDREGRGAAAKKKPSRWVIPWRSSLIGICAIGWASNGAVQ